MLKKFLVHTRRGIKFTILFMIGILLMVGLVAFLYKPTYSVFINGEQVGYTANKSELQHKINDYVEKGMKQMKILLLCKYKISQNTNCVY